MWIRRLWCWVFPIPRLIGVFRSISLPNRKARRAYHALGYHQEGGDLG